MRDVERTLIARYRRGERDLPGSTSETITLALAVADYQLLPHPWTDPLEAYVGRLDERQRRIVNEYRRWRTT